MRAVALAGWLLVLGSACAGSSNAVVSMTDHRRFEPARLTVEAGRRIVFTNDSDEVHTVTAYEDSIPAAGEDPSYFSSGGFDSETEARERAADGFIAPGDDYELRLSAPGTYRYFCIPHEDQGMTGTIVVQG